MLAVERLLEKKLLILTGKGGIGKTLVSAAIAQYAAEKGLRTLLVERSELDQLPPLFGQSKIGHKETQLAENLWAINIDSHCCFEEYVVKRLGQPKLYDKIFSHNVVRTFLHTIPGLGETMVLGRIYYTCVVEDPVKYDFVVFDAPASGHMYSLMTTPDAIMGAGLGGPLVAEVKRVRDFLADHSKVGAVYVAIPEELVVSECLEFIPKIDKETPPEMLGVLINRAYLPESDYDLSALDTLAKSSHPLSPAADYLGHKIKRSLDNQKNLHEGIELLRESGFKGEIGLLPELGAIPEPLKKGFGKSFLEALK